ncbi:hypothetical protein PIB30_006529 [Stylosanthes scabra]|uniref:DUF4283 domain-containing protein n=1 Tax=Stylosanthes scabra TaxID=79078 RepID=A0ABU6W5I6_9FABA|nr:hypothetical protein [Stylosanthes scabra]
MTIEDAEFISVPIWIQFWNLPEHYKSKEIIWKLGSSFGDVIEADLSQVRDLESSIVKAKVWLDLTKPLKRSLKIAGPNQKTLHIGIKFERIAIADILSMNVETALFKLRIQLKVLFRRRNGRIGYDQNRVVEEFTHQRIIPNLSQDKENNQSKQIKPVSVNLIKSLPSLSMNSRAESQNRGDEEEVISKSNPTIPANHVPETTTRVLDMIEHNSHQPQDFVFSSSTENSKSMSARLSIKKQARHKFKPISGVKRVSSGDRDDQNSKKQCPKGNFNTEAGEGATPQWAPNC